MRPPLSDEQIAWFGQRLAALRVERERAVLESTRLIGGYDAVIGEIEALIAGDGEPGEVALTPPAS